MTSDAIAGVACASMTRQPSSPTIIPEFGSPSAVKAYSPEPISAKVIFFAWRSLVEANPGLLMDDPSQARLSLLPYSISRCRRGLSLALHRRCDVRQSSDRGRFRQAEPARKRAGKAPGGAG